MQSITNSKLALRKQRAELMAFAIDSDYFGYGSICQKKPYGKYYTISEELDHPCYYSAKQLASDWQANLTSDWRERVLEEYQEASGIRFSEEEIALLMKGEN